MNNALKIYLRDVISKLLKDSVPPENFNLFKPSYIYSTIYNPGKYAVRINTLLITRAYRHLKLISNNLFSQSINFIDFKDIIYNQIVYANINNLDITNVYNRILQELKYAYNSKLTTYYCFIPICGINVSKRIDLGFVKIYPLKDRKLMSEKFNFSDIKLSNQYPFAKIKIQTRGLYTAIQLSEDVLKSLINSLMVCCSISIYRYELNKFNIYIGNNYINYNNNGKKEIIVSSNFGNKNSKIKSVIRGQYSLGKNPSLDLNDFLDKNIYGEMLPQLLYSNITKSSDHLYMNKDYIKYIIQLQRSRLTKYFSLINDNLNKRFNDANNYIAEGIRSTINSTKFLKFISAIEALVKFKKNNKKNYTVKSPQIINRVTRIIYGSLNKDNKDFRKQMKHLYNVRNYIIHGNLPIIDPYDVRYILDVSTKILSRIWILFIKRDKNLTDLYNFMTDN